MNQNTFVILLAFIIFLVILFFYSNDFKQIFGFEGKVGEDTGEGTRTGGGIGTVAGAGKDEISTGFLPLEGGMMAGDITLPLKNSISLLGPPKTGTSAVNKIYVDDTIAKSVDDAIKAEAILRQQSDDNAAKYADNTFLPLKGGKVSGDISMGSTFYVTSEEPKSDKQLANKSYVDKMGRTIGDSSKSYTDLAISKIPPPPELPFLPTAGGEIRGHLHLRSFPIEEDDATNKQYVDDLVQTTADNYLPLEGGEVSGLLRLKSIPAKPTDVTNKTYVDAKAKQGELTSFAYVDELMSKIPDNFLSLDGGTVFGNIDMNNSFITSEEPRTNKQLANKVYVDKIGQGSKSYTDTILAKAVADANNNLEMFKLEAEETFLPLTSALDYLPSTGGNLTGPLFLPSYTPTKPEEATNKTYVDSMYEDAKAYADRLIQTGSSGDIYLPLTGGSLSGPLQISFPSGPNDAVNKTFVDNAIAKVADGSLSLTGGTMKGDITIASPNKIILDDPTAPTSAANKRYVDLVAADTLEYVDGQISEQGKIFLSLSGGTMYGPLILQTPTSAAEAANKAYVDSILELSKAFTVARTSESSGTNPSDVTKSYVDSVSSAALDSAKSYADQVGSDITTVANAFAEQVAASESDAAKAYADQLNARNKDASEAYSNAVADAAKAYADQMKQDAKEYADTAISKAALAASTGAYLPLTGGALMGSLQISSTPTGPNDVTNKTYVDKISDTTKAYTDSILNAAKDYADTILASGNEYALAAASNEAKAYADQLNLDTKAYMDSIFLPLTGGTLSGPLRSLAPSNPSDVTNKTYVDTKVTQSFDAAKDYADQMKQEAKEYSDIAISNAALAASSGAYLPLAGGALMGPLQISSVPTGPNEVANKTYVDSVGEASKAYADQAIEEQVEGRLGQMLDQILPSFGQDLADQLAQQMNEQLLTQLESYLPLTGGSLTSPLQISTAPTGPNEVTNKTYVDSVGEASKAYCDTAIANAAYLPLTGGSMTGPLQISTVPTGPNEVTNKTYVDSVGETLKSYCDIAVSNAALAASQGAYLPLTGGALMGPLQISSVPTGPNEVTNKTYVDSVGEASKAYADQAIEEQVEGRLGQMLDQILPSFGQDLADQLAQQMNEQLLTQLESYLPLTGGSMSGPLQISSIPSNPNDITNKTYVDNLMSGYLPLSGGSLSGPLQISFAPASSNDIVNKEYVDYNMMQIKAYSDTAIANAALAASQGAYLPLTGGALMGPLQISSAPTGPNEVTNKTYVDSKLNELKTDAESYTDRIVQATLAESITSNGGTITGTLQLTKTPVNSEDVVNKSYVDTQVLESAANTLSLTGGTMKGDIIVSSPNNVILSDDPTNPTSAANKRYVDRVALDTLEYTDGQITLLRQDIISPSGGTMMGPLNLQTPMAPTEAANKSYVDAMLALGKIYTDEQASSSIALTGGTMTGALKIPSPVDKADAANKEYVESYIDTAIKNTLSLSGGTMSGDIIIPSPNVLSLSKAPINPTDAVNKEYVDKLYQQIMDLGGSGSVSLPSGAMISINDLPINPTDAINKEYVDTSIANATKLSTDNFNNVTKGSDGGFYVPQAKWALAFVDGGTVPSSGYLIGSLRTLKNNGMIIGTDSITVQDDGLYGINWEGSFGQGQAPGQRFAGISINSWAPTNPRYVASNSYLPTSGLDEIFAHEYLELRKGDKVQIRFWQEKVGLVTMNGGRLSVVKIQDMSPVAVAASASLPADIPPPPAPILFVPAPVEPPKQMYHTKLLYNDASSNVPYSAITEDNYDLSYKPINPRPKVGDTKFTLTAGSVPTTWNIKYSVEAYRYPGSTPTAGVTIRGVLRTAEGVGGAVKSMPDVNVSIGSAPVVKTIPVTVPPNSFVGIWLYTEVVIPASVQTEANRTGSYIVGPVTRGYIEAQQLT